MIRLFDRWSISCLPLSLIRCGSLDLLYPRRWQPVDSTRGQRLLSPQPLGHSWWFHHGTDRQGGQRENQYITEWKSKTMCGRKKRYIDTHLMWTMREIQTSNIHPCFDHLLQFGDGSWCRTWEEAEEAKGHFTFRVTRISLGFGLLLKTKPTIWICLLYFIGQEKTTTMKMVSSLS